MAETAGYPTTIKKGGAAVAFTNEATTKITANTVYRITDATKRVVDPTVAITVEVDADGGGGGGYVVAGPSTYTFNYYTGTVTFTADQGVDALVRVSGSYRPMLAVATGRVASWRLARQLLEASVFNTTGFRSYKYGTCEASGSLELLESGSDDHDPGAGTQKFMDDIKNGTLMVIEINMGAQGQYARAWVALESLDPSAQIDDLVKTQLAWKASGSGSAAVFDVSSV